MNKDLVKLLNNKKYDVDPRTIHLLSDCFIGNEFDSVESVIESIDNLVIQLNNIREHIERVRDGF